MHNCMLFLFIFRHVSHIYTQQLTCAFSFSRIASTFPVKASQPSQFTGCQSQLLPWEAPSPRFEAQMQICPGMTLSSFKDCTNAQIQYHCLTFITQKVMRIQIQKFDLKFSLSLFFFLNSVGLKISNVSAFSGLELYESYDCGNSKHVTPICHPIPQAKSATNISP